MFKKGNKYGVRHGMKNTRLYKVWGSIKKRCYNKNSKDYEKYGNRGIVMCDEWKNDFMSFYNWSIKNGYYENAKYGECTIDRINNDGIYEPNNCRWTNIREQSNNRRTNRVITYNEKTQTLSQWSREYQIHIDTLKDRLNRGWTIEQALTISTKGRNRKVK